MINSLVTVGIATYNSSKFITETLESVKNQTYTHIELIVSDDCSKDNTVDVINIWLNDENNRSRFANVNILVVESNTGVSANCNRIFNAASGIYLKLLAGDDILLSNCILDNLKFIESNPLAKIVFSQVGIFNDIYVPNEFTEIKPESVPLNLMNPNFDSKKQHEILLDCDRITYTPSVFFHRQTILDVGGFDESIRMIEDYPMWLKLTSSNIQLFYFNKVTVGYRRHSGALNYKNKETIFQPSVSAVFQIRKKYVFPHFSFAKKYAEIYEFFWIKIFIILRLNETKYKTIFISEF
jgi:alpha-1,3-rhamnosyltransferase